MKNVLSLSLRLSPAFVLKQFIIIISISLHTESNEINGEFRSLPEAGISQEATMT